MLVSTIFVISPVSLALFKLPFLVRARVPSEAQVSREAIRPPGCVSSHCTFSQSRTKFALGSILLPFRKARLLICLCYAMCLKPAPSALPCPHSHLKAGLGQSLSYFQGTHPLHPVIIPYAFYSFAYISIQTMVLFLSLKTK